MIEDLLRGRGSAVALGPRGPLDGPTLDQEQRCPLPRHGSLEGRGAFRTPLRGRPLPCWGRLCGINRTVNCHHGLFNVLSTLLKQWHSYLMVSAFVLYRCFCLGVCCSFSYVCHCNRHRLLRLFFPQFPASPFSTLPELLFLSPVPEPRDRRRSIPSSVPSHGAVLCPAAADEDASAFHSAASGQPRIVRPRPQPTHREPTADDYRAEMMDRRPTN